MTQNQTSYPHLSTLGLIGFSLNYAIERRLGDQISFDEVYDNIEDGDILEFLDIKFPGTFDWSLFEKGSSERLAIQYVFSEIAGGVRGRERRKLGIEKSGLSLLLSFTIEAMQQKFWR
ncbi:MAG: hypothetical protein MUC81_02525 [Bacteroidia bacterium]|jgi:hypothetical protein|nr:hypothetical protein [Bacteroidia bacterium]